MKLNGMCVCVCKMCANGRNNVCVCVFSEGGMCVGVLAGGTCVCLHLDVCLVLALSVCA